MYEQGENTYVAFFLDVPHPEHTKMAAHLIESVHTHMPMARVIQQSVFGVPRLPGVDELVIVSGATFPERRAKANAALPHPCLILDTDTVLMADPSHVFDEMERTGSIVAAATATHTSRKDVIKVNGGVIFFRVGLASSVFWGRFRDKAAKHTFTTDDRSQWLGIEQAWNEEFLKSPHTVLHQLYNQLPDQKGRLPAGTVIAHYRGDRKKFHPALTESKD